MNLKNSAVYNYFKILFGKSQYLLYSLFIEKISFFVFFIIVARQFSADTYGYVITIFAFCNIIIPLFDLGLPFYIHREAAGIDPNINLKFVNALSLKFYLFLPYLVLVLIYFYLINSVEILVVLIVLSALYLFSINHLFYRILYAKNLFRKVFYFYLLGRGILLAFALTGFLLKLNLIFILSAVLISSLIEFILLFSQLSKKKLIPSLRTNLDLSLLKEMLKSSTPMGVGLFFVLIYDRADVLFIENFISTKAAGFYAAAYSLYKLPHSVLGVVLTSVYTSFSKIFDEKKFIPKRSFYNIFSFFFFSAVFAIVGIYFLSDKILFLTFGAEFTKSSPVLQILIFSLPFILLNNLTGITLNSMRLEKKGLVTLISGAVMNVIVIAFIINRHSIFVIAFVTIATEAFIFFFQYYFIIRSQNLK